MQLKWVLWETNFFTQLLMSKMDKKLLDIICCPLCQSNLELVSEDTLVCSKCKKEYVVKNDIPILLPRDI